MYTIVLFVVQNVMTVIQVSVFYLIDVDFVTPLCSQVVYEGLVDDIFRIKCGKWSTFLMHLYDLVVPLSV